MKKFTLPLALTAFLLGMTSSPAQIVLTSSSYSQNFNSIPTNTAGLYPWTSNSTLPGWYGSTTGATTQYYRATNGNGQTPTTTAGSPTSLMAFRTSQTDAALGSVSNSTYHGVFGAQFVNNTGFTITSITITYTGEQWAWNTGAANTLDFAYSEDATSLSTGTWTDNNNLDFNALYSSNSTNQGLNGNSDTIFVSSAYVAKSAGQAGGPGALNYTTISATITGLSVGAGESLWIRWSDNFSGTGVGQGLGIDDFSLTAVPEPSTLSIAVVGFCLGAAVILRRRRCSR